MRFCVISPGVVHAVPRTVAFAPYLDEVHFVDTVGTADRAPLERAGVHYHVPAEGGGSRIASLDLQRLFARLAPDVIVCHYGSGTHFFNAIAFGRCPVAVIAMGNDVLYADGDTRVSHMERLLIRMGLRRAALISAKSRFLAEALRRLGVRRPVQLNYWGADLARFHPGDRAAARRELGLPAAGTLVLSLRAIEPLCNTHLIVEAFADVVRHRPDSRLLLLGRSMPGYRAAVEDKIRALGLGAKISLIGEVGQDALPAWYRASDVAVSVARVDGFPNSVLEVMACGVPLLAGDIPQLRELLTDGENARVCAIDAAAIARGIEALLADRDQAMAIAGCGRETVMRVGDIGANGRRFADELRAVTRSGIRPGTVSLMQFRAVLFSYLVLRRCFPG